MLLRICSDSCWQRAGSPLTESEADVLLDAIRQAAEAGREDLRQATETLRDDVRRVGRAVVSRPEAKASSSDAPSSDDRWALSLLPLADSLDRCVRAARAVAADVGRPRSRLWVTLPGDPRVDGVAEGVQLASAALEATLLGAGYRLERPAGVAFDAVRHCAVGAESGPAEAGRILRTETAGLWQGERLLREAGVVVSTHSEG